MTVKKWILGIGTELIILILLVMGIYAWADREREMYPVVYPEDVQTDMTRDGYEESEDLIKYMVYQLENQNLDYALRGCAFQNIAECFSLNYYTKYLDRFEYTDLIPPSDADSPAYISITSARLAAEYAQALEQLMDFLKNGELKLLKIEDDVPELQDGLYFETRSQICEILGARSLDEKSVYLQIGERTVELRWTLVRYRKYWNVLFFHPLQDESVSVVNIQDNTFTGNQDISIETYERDILPCNYYLLSNSKEDNPRTLIKRFFLCLQKEDALAAMSYMNVYRTDLEPTLSRDWLERQKWVALKVQEFYYITLLHDEEYIKWISKDISERGSDATKALSTTNMLFTGAESLEEMHNDGQTAEYDLYWIYEDVLFKGKFFLENRDGWKIMDIVYGW